MKQKTDKANTEPKADKSNGAELKDAQKENRESKPETGGPPPEEGEEPAAESNPAGDTEQPQTVVDWEASAREQEKLAVELVDRLQRNMAEFDNYRKRTIKEKAYIYDDGVRDTLEKLLPVVDNFERALAASDDKENSLYKGIEMTFRQLSDILKHMGVEAVPGEGELFDHNVHHAVAHIDDEAFGENVIAEVLQKGYKYKDKVLRPGMVKVAN